MSIIKGQDTHRKAQTVESIRKAEWDAPFVVLANGDVSYVEDSYVPYVEHDDEHDVLIDNLSDHPEWVAWTRGMSGQYAYRGAVMHPSELLTRDMAQGMLDYTTESGEPCVYIVTVVHDNDPESDDLVGWIILVSREA